MYDNDDDFTDIVTKRKTFQSKYT